MTEISCMLEMPSASERPWQLTRVRAPKTDESYVAEPALPLAIDVASNNRAALSKACLTIQGRTFHSLREWTRREVLHAAKSYTSDLLGGDVTELLPGAAEATDAAWYVGGHQPALFHPGVWVKNFVVGAMARAESGVGLNLVVDNDLLTSRGIRVPCGERTSPHVEVVPFDQPQPACPWEEARIQNQELFKSFPDRVQERMRGWELTPLLAEFWPAAVQYAGINDRLSDCLTAARNRWERRWGNRNLELPLSHLCQLDSFLWFTCHILANLPRFHALYNQILDEYRGVNHLRSRTHPVPDLRSGGGWFEAPFWIWKEGDQVRRRLHARQEGNEVWLSDARETIAAIPLSPSMSACCAVEVLRNLQQSGWRVRTRALTTTLFSRLFLADLFVHGLGGAKYDEMTDRLISRFFGLTAPGFLMLSATVRLPLGSFSVQDEDLRRLQHQLRELDFHSDRHLPGNPSPEATALAVEKARLIAEQQAARTGRAAHGADAALPSTGAGYRRYQRLREVNRRLADWTRVSREQLTGELSQTAAQLSANAILDDREYSFCLFPADKLERFMHHVCSEPGT